MSNATAAALAPPVTIPAGLWLRVSSGGQDEANQARDVEAYCAARGYTEARRYEVHGKSAYHGEHQEVLDQALADVRSGVIQVLVIWHSDRIERREGKALLDVLEEFTAAGGRVESVQEPTLGQLDFGGQVTTFITGLVNHEKSRHLAEQVALAHDRSRANGALIGRVPFGYVSAGEKYGKRLEPTELGRRYVPEIFRRVAEGEPLAQVAAWLDSEGVKPPSRRRSGSGWWDRTLSLMVRNPVYTGRRCEQVTVTGPQGGQESREYGKVVHRCEALVDMLTFRQAGEALKARPQRRQPRAEQSAMLAGVLYCPRCDDSPMYRVMCGRGASRRPYYRCTGRGPGRTSCGLQVRAEQADAAMDEIATREFATWHLTEVRRIPGHHYELELAELDYELRQLPLRTDLASAEMVAELGRLLAERDRLQSLPAVPDAIETVELENTYEELWASLSPPECGPWLAAQGFRVTADKATLTLYRDGHEPATADLATAELAPCRHNPPVDPVAIWQAGDQS